MHGLKTTEDYLWWACWDVQGALTRTPRGTAAFELATQMPQRLNWFGSSNRRQTRPTSSPNPSPLKRNTFYIRPASKKFSRAKNLAKKGSRRPSTPAKPNTTAASVAAKRWMPPGMIRVMQLQMTVETYQKTD